MPRASSLIRSRAATAPCAREDRPSLEIRKVWASAWEYRAVEERSFWNVDQSAVYMSVAVSTAFDDEAVNGVLITQNLTNPGAAGMYLNVQQGEELVTNPESGALPEVLTLLPGAGGKLQIVRQQFSSLSPEQPLMTARELATLVAAAQRVAEHFTPLYGSTSRAFDLEFKLVGPKRSLVIKQARPYASP